MQLDRHVCSLPLSELPGLVTHCRKQFLLTDSMRIWAFLRFVCAVICDWMCARSSEEVAVEGLNVEGEEREEEEGDCRGEVGGLKSAGGEVSEEEDEEEEEEPPKKPMVLVGVGGW
jgi:hypothetical protein